MGGGLDIPEIATLPERRLYDKYIDMFFYDDAMLHGKSLTSKSLRSLGASHFNEGTGKR